MSKLILSINVSLDSYADHTVATHADDEMHDFFAGLLENTAVAVFGRVTFELMQDYWPHAHSNSTATPSELAFADKYNAVPKVVFSRTLQTTDWSNSRIERGDLIEEIVRMKHQSGKDISLGGISVARQCMQRDLIDEYWFVVHPVVVGGGKPMFEGMKNQMRLRPIDTLVFRSGVTVLHYSREDR